MSIYMPREDVQRLTGLKKFGAQRRCLDCMKVKYDRAASGEPLVRIERVGVQRPVTGDRNIKWGGNGEQRVSAAQTEG